MDMTIVDKSDRAGPLDRVKITELGLFHAGLGTGALLGNPGAVVTKIEAGAENPER